VRKIENLGLKETKLSLFFNITPDFSAAKKQMLKNLRKQSLKKYGLIQIPIDINQQHRRSSDEKKVKPRNVFEDNHQSTKKIHREFQTLTTIRLTSLANARERSISVIVCVYRKHERTSQLSRTQLKEEADVENIG